MLRGIKSVVLHLVTSSKRCYACALTFANDQIVNVFKELILGTSNHDAEFIPLGGEISTWKLCWALHAATW